MQFVNHASRTRDMKGVKRCKILGKGSDKAQITVTIFVTESGEVLPYQMIFEGKTTKCHPVNQIKPNDCLWTHTQSHWQTVPTYMDAIENIIVPYKNNVISRMGLPSNQHTILKHDLHYTHKDSRVLELMKSHNILPLFVPAGCTDLMQECDTVVNKPFKHAVKLGYKNHLDGLFQIFLDGGNNAALWQPKLTLGALKPFITAWVALGIQALKTPEMKVTIRNAFANDGLFTAIRDPIKLLEMQVESALNMGEEEIFIPAEAEKSDRDEELVLADLSASDSGSDSDSD